MSETSRNQFTFYRSYYEAIRELPKREQAAVMLAICAYALDGEEPMLMGTTNAFFKLIRPTLDAGKRKASSGGLGGRPKQNGSKAKANGKQAASKQEANGKQTASEIEIEKEIEVEVENKIEIEKEIEKKDKCLISDSVSDETEFSAPPAGASVPLTDFVNRWNSLGLTQITRLAHGTTRYKLLKARISEYGYDAVTSAVEKIRASDFLMGRTDKPFSATLDWFLKPNNFPKVLDGNYDNAKRSDHGGNPFLELLNEEASHDTR